MHDSDQSLKAEMRAAISDHRRRIRGRRPRWLVGDEPQGSEHAAEPVEPEPVEAELPQRRWWQLARRH